MAEILQITVIAIGLGLLSVALLRSIIPSLYKQDRRLAQLIYLNFFWVAVFFVVYLYERNTISSLGFTLGTSPLVTLEYTILAVLVTLFMYIFSARREKNKGTLRVEDGFLVIDKEKVDLRMISSFGFAQTFLMQIMWVALPLEIFFRGYLITRIAMSFSDFAAVLLSSLVFFVAYFDRPIFGNINLVLALMWGYCFIATGSIIPGLVAHVFINTMSFYFARNIAISRRV